ncbi:alpha/beta hydrolase fold domain-containing protein [Trujillonella endophytica]|uniref:Acetyl esterase/lipase n=1 Tax=Trujillonella endophytica TaxID=673521 RepID=A0A1H8UR49_9ACTN|nr:alpha/beta hydrolase fold domain-containing protein [Trujillella endophytica]SEP05394.1 Acetyl esterase/lipase [Trujillella endophytica]
MTAPEVPVAAVRAVPPYDTELIQVHAPYARDRVTLAPEMIPVVRPVIASTAAHALAGRPIIATDHTVPGLPGAPDVTVTVLERPDRRRGGPAVLYLHGGGLVIGDRFFGLGPVLGWVEDLDAVLVTVEYRLAPEHPYPAALDDCAAALSWLAAEAAPLGVDPGRLVLAGASAGGGLAAGLALRVRDSGGPALAAQVLIYPMLDDRNDTVSSRQFDGFGRWDRGSNDTGWDAYLGDRRGTDAVEAYAAPGRAPDLSGLPPTYIDVGSAEVFRDEDVAYASQLWADGGECELHVWPGGFHAFDMEAPTARLSAAMVETRTAWLRRTLLR